MNIDINQISSNRPDGPKRQDNSKAASASTENVESKTSAPQDLGNKDSVSLSSTAQNLAKIETELKSLPEINQSKVDEIKSQIQNNTYQIDSQNLAQKMLNTEV
jgi:negative regulator of flagellin synthesis FlgM